MALIRQIKQHFDKNGKIKARIRHNRVLYWMYYGVFLKIRNYPQNKNKRILIQTHGHELLKHLHEVLEGESITYFVDFGTLLGVIRENMLLTHDLDMDIGVLLGNSNTRIRVQNALQTGGCKLERSYVYNDNIVEQSYMYKGIKFDVCFYETEGANSVCYLFYEADDSYLRANEMNVVKMRYSLIEGVQEYEFAGITVNVPDDPERLLEEKYGADWRIPNKSWVYWKAPTAEYCDDLGEVVIYGK